ncbi:MAG: hypothetical protein AAFV47_10035 [Pseudomonadota bacterium]
MLTVAMLSALATVANAQSQLPLCAPTEIKSPVVSQPAINADGTITLESGAGIMDFEGNAQLSQGVRVERDALLLTAEKGTYSGKDGTLSLNGAVSYRGSGADIVSEEAVLSASDGRVSFADAEFSLGNGASRGAASLLAIDREGTLELNEVNYTTCPPEVDDWLVRAGSIILDETKFSV